MRAAGWHGKGQHYHSMFQFLLAGVNGAFLTGTCSTCSSFRGDAGCVLWADAAWIGSRRIKAGLHYIAINLAASLFCF